MKQRVSKINMVSGEDPIVEQALKYFGKDFIGNFRGHYIPNISLNMWIQGVQVPLFGYGPTFHLLAKG